MWIPFDEALLHSPPIVAMAAQLHLSPAAVLGHVVTIAIHCFKTNSTAMRSEDVEAVALWTGPKTEFLNAAIQARVLIADQDNPDLLHLEESVWSATGGRYQAKKAKAMTPKYKAPAEPYHQKPEDPVRLALYERAGVVSPTARRSMDELPVELIAAWIAYVERTNFLRAGRPLGPGLIVTSVTSGAWPPNAEIWKQKGLEIIERLNGHDESPFVLE